MAPSRKKGVGKAAAARREWKVGDLVLTKVKGFPAWPAADSSGKEVDLSVYQGKVQVGIHGWEQRFHRIQLPDIQR